MRRASMNRSMFRAAVMRTASRRSPGTVRPSSGRPAATDCREADANTAQFDVEIAFSPRKRSTHSNRQPSPWLAPLRSPADWQPQAEGLPHRLKRLTPFSSVPLFNALTPDGQSLIVVVLENPARVVGWWAFATVPYSSCSRNH